MWFAAHWGRSVFWDAGGREVATMHKVANGRSDEEGRGVMQSTFLSFALIGGIF
jgi:hypothetical protein